MEVDFSNTRVPEWNNNPDPTGSHSQVDIPEWNNNPNPNARYEKDDPGFAVPDVFRTHRHSHSGKPAESADYRKQIKYRCGHIGTKELEIVLMDWLDLHVEELTYAELEQFDADVLDLENPSMQRYLMNGDALEPEHDNKYMKILVKYVSDRKSDYASNVPSSRLIRF